jgi:hypothetical protein
MNVIGDGITDCLILLCGMCMNLDVDFGLVVQ